jgi:hypothetical protein
VPFVIRLSDGTSIHVYRPHAIATGRNSPVCAVDHNGRVRFVAYHKMAEVVIVPVDEAAQEWL